MDNKQLMMVPYARHHNILVENHTNPIAEHVGINRTMELIKRNYWRRGIWGDVAAYVRSCPGCQCMKSENQKKTSELQPTPFLERAWQHKSRRVGPQLLFL